MQRVERQKHKDRKRGRLAGVLVCAVLLIAGITAGLLLRQSAEEEPPHEVYQPVTGYITQREPEELRSLTVIQKGKTPWTVERQEDGTLQLLPEDGNGDKWPVDDSMTRILTEAATTLTFEDVLTEKREEWEPNEEVFGLKDPRVRAEICFTDGTEVSVRIGDSADAEENSAYYMAVDGQDRLYLTSAGTMEDLSLEKELLHPVPKLDIKGKLLDRITVRNGDGSIRMEWALKGQITDQDAQENWLLTVPYTYPADYETMENMRTNAENLRLGTYVGSADEKTLKQCGLDEPSMFVELHMAAGSIGTVGASGVYDVEDREEASVLLTVGGSKSDLSVYVLYENEVYTVSYVSLNVFTNTKPQTTVARYVVMTPLNSLESVTVSKPGETEVRYELTRTSGTPSEDSEEETQTEIRCTRNGEEISYDAFAAAWERLLTVTVSGKLPDGFQPGEPYVSYRFHSVSGATHTAEFSNYDGIHDAVTLDGYTLFYLIKDGMTNLP